MTWRRHRPTFWMGYKRKGNSVWDASVELVDLYAEMGDTYRKMGKARWKVIIKENGKDRSSVHNMKKDALARITEYGQFFK